MSTQFPETFDPETQEGNSWELLPVNEYVAQIVEASVQQPKSGDGCYLALTWKIIEGELEDRQLWQRITFAHSSEQAQTIGRKTLKDLCVALDVNEQVGDAEVFLFKPARIGSGSRKTNRDCIPTRTGFPASCRWRQKQRNRNNRHRQRLPKPHRRRRQRERRSLRGPRRPRSMACTTLVLRKDLVGALWERRRPLIGRCSSCVHISGKHSPR